MVGCSFLALSSPSLLPCIHRGSVGSSAPLLFPLCQLWVSLGTNHTGSSFNACQENGSTQWAGSECAKIAPTEGGSSGDEFKVQKKSCISGPGRVQPIEESRQESKGCGHGTTMWDLVCREDVGNVGDGNKSIGPQMVQQSVFGQKGVDFCCSY